jgi:hypothetical protein
MSDEVSLKIQCCNQCPHWESLHHFTDDSWEDVREWSCKKSKGRHITYQEWNDPLPPIPEWCPLRKEQQCTS